jgi:ferrous iron transport protein A
MQIGCLFGENIIMSIGRCGQTWKITGFVSTIPSYYRQRFLAMGFLPGTLITLLQMAPLGDPFVFLVRGVRIALRENEWRYLVAQFQEQAT